MDTKTRGIVTVISRIMIALIFLMSAIGNKIPQFSNVVEYMKSEGVPAPQMLLVGAIIFLLAGSFSVIAGYKVHVGASLLLIFLVLATYYFHDFWTFEDAKARQLQTIQFMKNVGLMGAMLFLIANGSGPMSLDRRIKIENKS